MCREMGMSEVGEANDNFHLQSIHAQTIHFDNSESMCYASNLLQYICTHKVKTRVEAHSQAYLCYNTLDSTNHTHTHIVCRSSEDGKVRCQASP